jgi:hypothetical protein
VNFLVQHGGVGKSRVVHYNKLKPWAGEDYDSHIQMKMRKIMIHILMKKVRIV